MLTEVQINNIHKLDANTLLHIMHECAEALGVVSVQEYCRITCTKRRTVYAKMNEGKLKHLKIDNHKFPIINERR